MNVHFDLLQGDGAGCEMSLDLYNPAHGVDGSAHRDTKKTALVIKQRTPEDRPEARSFRETIVLMSKSEARAIASALMGTAAEL